MDEQTQRNQLDMRDLSASDFGGLVASVQGALGDLDDEGCVGEGEPLEVGRVLVVDETQK